MSPRINAITLLVIALAACSANRRRTPDDTIVMLIESPMTTADPRFTITNYDAKLSRLVAPGLTTVDTPTAEPQLELAAAIERIDATTVDVTLRDAKFSDGRPVRAEDVARTYETAMRDDCGSLYVKNLSERFARVEPVGDRRVRFHLVKPLGTFMTDIEFGVVSFHDVPPGQCRSPIVIGAGPFMLREITSRHVRLDANPHYKTPAKIAHVHIKFVRDAAARLLMLAGGSADLVQNAFRVDLVDDVTKRPRVQAASAPSVLLTYMLINNQDPALKDRRVRQAIALAIDRPALVAAKFSGRAVLATGLMPPTHWAYNPDVANWQHDLARANQLLDAAGLAPDPAGIRLRLVYKTSADAFRVSIARQIARQLRAVGIEVEVRPFEFGTFFTDIKRGNFQIATMQSPEITEPDFYYTFFHSTRWPSAKDPNATNRWRYANPAFDKLVEDGRAELDPEQRKQLYAQAQRIIAEDLPIIPLWHEDNIILANTDVRDYMIVPNARFIGLVRAWKSP